MSALLIILLRLTRTQGWVQRRSWRPSGSLKMSTLSTMPCRWTDVLEKKHFWIITILPGCYCTRAPEGCAWGRWTRFEYGRGITLKGSLLIRREVYFACYQFKGCSRNEVFFFSWLKGRLPRTPRNGDEDDLSRISCSWDGLWNTMAYNVISCEKIERNTKKKIKIADFTM